MDSVFRFISKYEDCDELKTKTIKYGLETIYNVITKFIILGSISIIFGIWKEYLLLTLLHAFIRRYSYGLHAKSSMLCWFTTTPIYFIGCIFIRFGNLPIILSYIIWTFCFISFLLWAPADTPSRPLIHKDKRKKQKIKTCLVSILYLVGIFLFPQTHFSNALIYSLFIQAITINPLTYLLTKTPYENYKLYYEKHGLNY